MSEIYSAPVESEDQAEIAFSLFAFQLYREMAEEAEGIVENTLTYIDRGFMDFSQALMFLSTIFDQGEIHD